LRCVLGAALLYIARYACRYAGGRGVHRWKTACGLCRRGRGSLGDTNAGTRQSGLCNSSSRFLSLLETCQKLSPLLLERCVECLARARTSISANNTQPSHHTPFRCGKQGCRRTSIPLFFPARDSPLLVATLEPLRAEQQPVGIALSGWVKRGLPSQARAAANLYPTDRTLHSHPRRREQAAPPPVGAQENGY